MKDERREKILLAAVQVFAHKGFAAAKIADIAKVAGMSHGLIYHYFPSKEAVYLEVVEMASLEGIQLTQRAMEQPGTPWNRLRYLCENMLDGVREHPEFILISIQTFISEAIPEEAQASIQEHGRVFFSGIVQLIQQGQEAGQVVARNPAELAVAYYATLQGLAISSMVQRRGTSSLPDGTLLQIFPSVDTVLHILKA